MIVDPIDLEMAEAWCWRQARRLAPLRASIHDDLVNEGLLAWWRALGTHDAQAYPDEIQKQAYCKRAAILVMTRLAHHGANPTTSEDRPYAGHPKAMLSLDYPVGMEGEKEISFGETLVGPEDDLVDLVAVAYHRGDLLRALEALAPEDREFVERRFWHDHTVSEIARDLGINQGSLTNRWVRRIRPALAESLAHLREVA